MGEIANAMLDGTFCQYCGEDMGREGDGYRVSCPSCKHKEPKFDDKQQTGKSAQRRRARARKAARKAARAGEGK